MKNAAIVLAALLLINAVLNPQFVTIHWQNGHAYGALIDIANRAAPLKIGRASCRERVLMSV